MLRKVVRWILNAVDLDVVKDGSELIVRVEFHGVQVFEWRIDLERELVTNATKK